MDSIATTTAGRLGRPPRVEQTESGVADLEGAILAAAWQGVLPDLTRLVAALGISHGARDDILQDVYMRAMRRADPQLRGDDLRRWLFRVTVNRCHEEHRRRSRWRRVWDKISLNVLHTGGTVQCGEVGEELARKEGVAKALATLPERLHTLLVMRYFMEMDSKQIGEVLERPSATVRSQLCDARQRLAAELTTMGFAPEEDNENNV